MKPVGYDSDDGDGDGDGYGYGYGDGYGDGYGYGDGDGYGYGDGYGDGYGSILTARACGFELKVHSIDRIALGCQVHSLAEWRQQLRRLARSNNVDTGEAEDALRFVESLFNA